MLLSCTENRPPCQTACFTTWWFGNAEEMKANISCSLSESQMFCALAACKKKVKRSKEKKIKLQMPYQPSSRRSSPPSPSGPRCPQLKVLRWMVLERAETQKPSSPVKGRSLHISYKYTLLCLTHILL